MSWKAFFLIVLPIMANLALTIWLVWIGAPLLKADSTLSYWIVSAAALAAFVGIGGLVIHEIRRFGAMASLVVQAMLLIVIFALIYQSIGIKGVEGPATFAQALYFSIVTWTTLGYGDLQPHESLQLVAATEAAFGYIFFGLIVAIAGSLLSKRDAA